MSAVGAGDESRGVAIESVACARHHNVQTYLRCGRCGTPICPKCLVHSPVGARCPDCGRPTRIAGPGASRTVVAGAAALGIGMVGGIAMSFVPGVFMILPLVLLGFLVGEAVSAITRGRGGRGPAILAFACAVVGPILGRAAIFGLALQGDVGQRSALALVVSLQSLGAMGLLLLLLAGVIASSRLR